LWLAVFLVGLSKGGFGGAFGILGRTNFGINYASTSSSSISITHLFGYGYY
jgi:hypothetical protein